MVQAIIFDLYGVLALNGWQAFKLHHFADREDIWTEVFELGRKVDAGQADYNELIRFTAGQTGETEATVRYQLEHTVVNQAVFDYIESDLQHRYKLGILSNASTTQVVDEIFTSDQRRLFDSITLSHDVSLTKPDKAMYTLAANRIGIDIGNCLFIDDQVRHANGARMAGMQAVVFTDVSVLKQEIAKLV